MEEESILDRRCCETINLPSVFPPLMRQAAGLVYLRIMYERP